MDEVDNFEDLCLIKTRKPPPEPFDKLLRTTSRPDNVKKIYKTGETMYEWNEPLTTKTAVEFLLNDKLKSAVCRYCLNITPGLSELDQVLNIAGSGSLYKVTIRQMIACFYPVKANEDPNFPDKICQKCLDKAINAYLFTQQCEQAERALLFCFNDMYEKMNKLDPIDRPKKRGRQKLNPNYNILYAEHKKVIDYAEPVRNIINVAAESLSTEPDWKEFECKKCWQVFPNIDSLLNHEKIHPKEMWYNCRLCGKSFLKLTQLKKHHNQVHVLGKIPEVAVEKLFRCEQCAHVSETHTQHLQHLEMHKFKCVLQHLIHRKMDKLCMVCLNNSATLEDLEKMISFNGGFPELLGDKTLQSVLASVLPDTKPNSYRDTTVAQVTKLLLTKSDSKLIPNDNNPTSEWPSPIVVTKDKFKTDNFYYYVFSDPELETDGKKTDENSALDTETSVMHEVTVKNEVGLDNNDNEVPTHSRNIKRLTRKFVQKKIVSRKGLKRTYPKGIMKTNAYLPKNTVATNNLKSADDVDEEEEYFNDLKKQITELIEDGNKDEDDLPDPVATKKQRFYKPKQSEPKNTVNYVEMHESNNNNDDSMMYPDMGNNNVNNVSNYNFVEDETDTTSNNNNSDESVVYQKVDPNLENEMEENDNNLDQDTIDPATNDHHNENESEKEKRTTNFNAPININETSNKKPDSYYYDWEKYWVFGNSFKHSSPTTEEERPTTEAREMPDCKQCWIFKNWYRCECCKKINKTLNRDLNDIPLPEDPKPITENVTIRQTKEYLQLYNEVLKQPPPPPPESPIVIPEDVWQCDICQTANPIDVLRCKCLDSYNIMDIEYRTTNIEDSTSPQTESSDGDVIEIKQDDKKNSCNQETQKDTKIEDASIDLTDSVDSEENKTPEQNSPESKSVSNEDSSDSLIKFDIGATTISGRRPKLPKAFHK